MPNLLRHSNLVGQKVYGYCDGYFGLSYTTKIIEAIGKDWIVAREIKIKSFSGVRGEGYTNAVFANLSGLHDKDVDSMLERWLDPVYEWLQEV